jgi:hypothetical protein
MNILYYKEHRKEFKIFVFFIFITHHPATKDIVVPNGIVGVKIMDHDLKVFLERTLC